MEGTTLNAGEQYAERDKRVMDTVALKKVDRVPLATLSDFFLVRSQGLTCAEAMYDHGKRNRAVKAAVRAFDWDMVGQPAMMLSGRVMDTLDIRHFSWPGAGDPRRRLPPDSIYQYHERETLLADEVDEFLRDPSDFALRKLFPRMAGLFEPLSHLTVGLTALSMPHAMILGFPLVTAMLGELGTKARQAADEHLLWQASQDELVADLKAMGYPVTHTVFASCAFDWVADHLRGTKGSMLDMYRQPDKLKALVEYFEPVMINATVMMAEPAEIKRVFIPLHKGAAGFMSDRQFGEFYWPQLRRFYEALIERGLTPEPFYEGDYTPRLAYLAELPPGKVMGHYDRVDRRKHKEVLGNTACFWGDIPGGLLVTGTPDQVRDHVKELIDDFPDGGLIVDGASNGIPLEARKENVMAVTETVMEYGRY